MNRTLGARLARLERAAAGDTCPCGTSTVYDTITMALAGERGHVDEDVCRACGGPLPKIPFAWIQRLAADRAG